MAAQSFEETAGLVAAAQAGDETAVNTLFDRYYPRIRQIVALRLGKPLAAMVEDEDIVQESMLDAFCYLDNYQVRGEGSFLNWIATLVRNNVRDQWRKAHTLKRGAGRVRPLGDFSSSVLTDSVFEGKESTPSEISTRLELEAKLEQAVLKLDDLPRRVFELRCLCGMSYREVADDLAIESEATVRSIHARTLSRLSMEI